MAERKQGRVETVLLAEDEAPVRMVIRRALEQEGYRVLEAEGGAAAVEIAEAHAGPIDLLITDVAMPGMSGRELVARIIGLRPETRILLISGHAEGELAEHGLNAVHGRFLPKPFSPETLMRRVREALAS